jgi:hypothetical protein
MHPGGLRFPYCMCIICGRDGIASRLNEDGSRLKEDARFKEGSIPSQEV